MNIWLIVDVVLLLGVLPCAWVILSSSDIRQWVIALAASAFILLVAVLSLSQVIAPPSFFDLTMALGLVSIPSGLLLAHVLAHWLG